MTRLPRGWSSLPVIAVAVYLLAWIAGLAIQPPAPAIDASAIDVASHFQSERATSFVRSLLVHGVSAGALIAIASVLYRAARSHGELRTGRILYASACAGAVVSFLQMALGFTLAATAETAEAGRANSLFDAINRLDGVKMIAFAVMASAGVVLTRRGAFPRWLGVVGSVLGGTLLLSAAGYLLLDPNLATAAFISLPLLLVWVSGSGLFAAQASMAPHQDDRSYPERAS